MRPTLAAKLAAIFALLAAPVLSAAQTVKTTTLRTTSGGAGTISLGIVNYVDNELITFKVNLNDAFSEKLRSEDDRLQEVIQLQRLPNGGTRVVSMMLGWGTGAEWDKAIAFFAKGNEWSYKNLAKCVGGPLER